MSKHVLTSVAWPYANGPRHIGHVAGFGVPSDVFARYERMSGNEVLMVSGTDEHGTPLLVQAEKEGVPVQELADRYNRVIVEDLAGLGLSYDLFTRTTTRNHYAVVRSCSAAQRQRLHGEADPPGPSTRRPAAPCRTASSRAPARSAGRPTPR
jgi:methionyl-tRNA synthetase